MDVSCFGTELFKYGTGSKVMNYPFDLKPRWTQQIAIRGKITLWKEICMTVKMRSYQRRCASADKIDIVSTRATMSADAQRRQMIVMPSNSVFIHTYQS